MDKDMIVRFLTKEAIKTPNRPKHEDRLWAAIRKAHRDVMTGARTGNIKTYAEKNRGEKENTLEELYKIILKEKEPLFSELLITKIQKHDDTLEFAAVQKLVNMTLKYLIILNECEETTPAFAICEEKCDCPIDSVILKRLEKINGEQHTCWTKMEKSEYKVVQKEIQEYLQKEDLQEKYPKITFGNIWFDFLMWKVD